MFLLAVMSLINSFFVQLVILKLEFNRIYPTGTRSRELGADNGAKESVEIAPFLHVNVSDRHDFTARMFIFLNYSVLCLLLFSYSICSVNYGSVAANNHRVPLDLEMDIGESLTCMRMHVSISYFSQNLPAEIHYMYSTCHLHVMHMYSKCGSI